MKYKKNLNVLNESYRRFGQNYRGTMLSNCIKNHHTEIEIDNHNIPKSMNQRS